MKNLFKQIAKRSLKIPKRFRFVISTMILSGVMLVSTAFYFDKAIFFIPLLIGLTYILTYFSLLEGIEKIEWFSLFFMELLVSLSFYLIFFLFPSRWITRVPFVLLYAISLYAMLLCSNIFNVGVEKSLQLYRAAFSVNFFYQSFILFLLLNTLFSFKLDFFLNGLIVGGLVFLLSFHLIWTNKLRVDLEKENMIYSLFIAAVIAQGGMILSFVPLKTSVFALFLTAAYYSVAGLIYHNFDKRLFKETIREYLFVLTFTFLIMILTISW